MGLSIYYRMRRKCDADAARDLVSRLHRFAKTLPFDEVTDVYEYDPPDGRYVFAEARASAEDWKPGAAFLPRKRDDGLEELVEVPALHAMVFHANLAGSETASFGLASHPPVVVHREDVVTRPPGCSLQREIGAGPAIEFTTRLRGWYSWSNGCKTQYAANPRYGGVDNFLRAHLSVFRAVDECRRLGMTTRIRDDGKYWRHRDADKLLKELAKWDELIAGFAGKLSDRLGDGAGQVAAPIKDRADFEHLEARGVSRLHKAGRRRRKNK